MLNIPHAISTALEGKNNVLLFGIGGGGDILIGMPVYYSLVKLGKKVHLASLTHTDLKAVNEFADPIILGPSLYGANSSMKIPPLNYVEGYTAQFFKASTQQDMVIWMFDRTSVPLMKKSYERLIDHLKIDAIILVDGGVDSIMIGNESSMTNRFVETSFILKVFQEMPELNGKVFSVVCNDGLRQIKNNLSTLALQGGFYGGCYLLNFMRGYQLLSKIYGYIKNNNELPNIERLIKITEGDFDDGEEKIAPIEYLFFNTEALAYNNTIISNILEDMSYFDITQLLIPIIKRRISAE